MAAARGRSNRGRPATQRKPAPTWLPGFLTGLGLLVGVVAIWFRLPGALIALLISAAGAWSASPPEMTGRKDLNGYPTSANDYEAAQMRRYRFWADLKWRLLVPTSSLKPGWTPYASFAYGIWAGLVLWCLPHHDLPTHLAISHSHATSAGSATGGTDSTGSPLLAHLPALLDAISAFVLVTQFAAARRRTVVEGDTSPGVRLWFLASLGSPFRAARDLAARTASAVSALLFGRSQSSSSSPTSHEPLLTRLRTGITSLPSCALAGIKTAPGAALTRVTGMLGMLSPRRLAAGLATSGTGAVRSRPRLVIGTLVVLVVATWAARATSTNLAHQAAGGGYRPTGPTWLPGLLAFVGVAGALVAPAWIRHDLGPWRQVVAARREWTPRWPQIIKGDESPTLIAHEQVGDATVDTFIAPASLGGAAFFRGLGEKIMPTIGSGVRLAVLSCPDQNSDGSPNLAIRHPLKFRVAIWPSDATPDLAAAETPEDVARLFLECAMTWVGNSIGYPVPILEEAIRLLPQPPQAESATDVAQFAQPAADLVSGLTPGPDDTPDGDIDDWEPDGTCVWATTWIPDGATLGDYRMRHLDTIEATVGAGTLIDWDLRQNTGVMYLGATDRVVEGITYAAETGDPSFTPERAELLIDIKEWDGRHADVLQNDVNLPVYQPATRQTLRLATGQEIHRLAFATRTAIDPRTFFPHTAKYKNTLAGAPFLCLTGYKDPRSTRPGEWHPQAFVIYWSRQAVPETPDSLVPMPGPDQTPNVWVLTGRVTDAFKAAGLRQPSVYAAQPLTVPSSPGHIWRIGVRFDSGVTLADVRGRAERIRSTMGCEWLRIQEAEEGCFLVVGASPARARVHPRFIQDVTDLDWQQFFLDVGVLGRSGIAPKVIGVDHLPRNQQVEVIDFTLPAGLSLTEIKDKAKKLTTASRRAFFEVRPAPSGKPEEFRVLACETNPMPSMVSFDFEESDRSLAEGYVFATGVEGEPIIYSPATAPHLLAVGATGAGKSSLIQPLLYGFLADGAEAYIIDPSKGGADFMFAKPYAKAFAQHPIDAAKVMKAIYAEVKRRKDVNATFGVGNFLDLPDDVRPPRLLVLIDEFTSLIMQETLPTLGDDPSAEDEEEYEKAVAENKARVQIGALAGRIAREARSAGVTLILGTQRLTAKILDSIPGSQDLKTNMARIILGATALGERQTALRNPYDVPEISETKPGRGLWEPLQGPGSNSALMIQSWYASQDTYAAALAQRIKPLPPEAILDVSAADSDVPSAPSSSHQADGTEPVVEHEDLIISLADLDLDLDPGVDASEAESTAPAPTGLDAADLAPDAVLPEWFAESYKQQVYEARGDQPAEQPDEAEPAETAEEVIETEVVWDRIDPTPWLPADGTGEYGWAEIDALLGFLKDFPEVEYVEWSDPHLSDMDEMGVTFAETARDLLSDRGLRLGGLLAITSQPRADVDQPQGDMAEWSTPLAMSTGQDEDLFDRPAQVAPALLPDLADDPFA